MQITPNNGGKSKKYNIRNKKGDITTGNRKKRINTQWQ